MFGFFRKDKRPSAVEILHEQIVAASRRPGFYGDGGLPDTVEGRFESLALHVLLVLRRLRQLPAPAQDVAQDLVDAVFAHLEIALRELGVGDFGVPKRMKKIAGAFYDRTRLYDPPLDRRDAEGLSREISDHLGLPAGHLATFSAYCLASEIELGRLDLESLFAAPRFATVAPAASAATQVAI